MSQRVFVRNLGGTPIVLDVAEASDIGGPASQPLDGDLTAIAAMVGTGFAEKTAPDTWQLSNFTGTGNVVRASSPTIVSPTITTSPTATGATWTDLGSVTTVDINGGTVDGTVLGGSSAAAATFTTAVATTSVQSPICFGGTAVGSSLTLKSTSGAGTTDLIDFLVGNNGAVRAFRVTTDGTVTFGPTGTAVLIGGNTAKMQINSQSTTDIAAFSIAQFTNDAQGPNIVVCKSRGTTVGSFGTALSADDVIGSIDFRGSDGTIDRAAARITVTAATGTTWGSGDSPGNMTFRTTPDGSSTLAIALTIQSTQILKFGTASFQANGTGTVTITNVAPAGVATATITKWLRIDDASGVDTYIPVWQ